MSIKVETRRLRLSPGPYTSYFSTLKRKKTCLTRSWRQSIRAKPPSRRHSPTSPRARHRRRIAHTRMRSSRKPCACILRSRWRFTRMSRTKSSPCQTGRRCIPGKRSSGVHGSCHDRREYGEKTRKISDRRDGSHLRIGIPRPKGSLYRKTMRRERRLSSFPSFMLDRGVASASNWLELNSYSP
jgi:hypothetical protein